MFWSHAETSIAADHNPCRLLTCTPNCARTTEHYTRAANANLYPKCTPDADLSRNDGAKHKGEWSRLDLQRNPGAFAKFALSALTAKLPPTAHTFYFRDEIGNISTSNIRYISFRWTLGGGRGVGSVVWGGGVGWGGGGVEGEEVGMVHQRA